jgi:hypothetical protein
VFDGHGTVTWSVAVSRRLLASVLAGILTGPWAFAGEDALPASKCEGASKELLGSPAVRPGAKARIPEPKKVKHVRPKLPTQWPKECKSTITIFEALVGPSGKVEQVWTLRSPCKEIERAGLEALRQWEYEPVRVEGKAVPYCMTVTTMVHLR